MKSAPSLAAAALLGLAACATPAADAPAGAEAGPHHGHRHAQFTSGRFHVLVEGQGPDLILIPGLSSHPDVWQPLVDRLDGPHTIHRLHLQGFAGAPALDNADGLVAAPVADELARYIREQGLRNPVVIGHSMGGTIALMLAARHPDLVGRVMIVDQIPFMGQAFGDPNATSESVRPLAGGVRAGMIAMTPDQWRDQNAASLAGMIRDEADRAGPLDHVLATDRTVAANAMQELIVTDLRPELSAIGVPVQVLYVALTRVGLSPEATDALFRSAYATLPGVVLRRIDEAGHFVMLDQPDVLAEAVNDFVK